MNEPWTIERARPADIDELLRFALAYHAFEHITQSEGACRTALRALLADEQLGIAWFACHAGERVGHIVLCPGFSIEFGGRDAFVDEFYLLPEHRGTGGGRLILEAVKRAALELGLQALHLEVARDNTPARRLYVRSGFEAREKYVLMSHEL